MKYLKIFTFKEKKAIEKELNSQFGIRKVPGMIVQKGKERLFLYIGELKPKEFEKIEDKIIIERVGIYFAKQETSGIRLSMEGVQFFKNQITKNIFDLNEEQLKEWMHGNELNISTGKKGFIVMKYNDNYISCGKASDEKITNFVPKNRRIKYKN